MPYPLDNPRVILESPYAGIDAAAIAFNVAYARACIHDSLIRGEAPIASHLLYTQPGILNDENPGERAIGIDAGHAWFRAAGAIVVYTDLGITSGMRLAIDRAAMLDTHVHYRSLGDGVLELLHIEHHNVFDPFPAQPDTNQEK